MAADTRTLVGGRAERVESRSLFMDRFGKPEAVQKDRSDWFKIAALKAPYLDSVQARSAWCLQTTKDFGGAAVYAQLLSRLMVNMAGGVMENAGLCIDRFGIPYIPGSTVKGCARKAALAVLREWSETRIKPEAADNLFARAVQPFESRQHYLAQVARIFGWSSSCWRIPRGNQGLEDFAWSCDFNKDGAGITEKAMELLSKEFSGRLPADHAGTLSFLPAYPVDPISKELKDHLKLSPPLCGTLALDIVTCHHGDYYTSTAPDAVARDVEEPVPVVFPTVAEGHLFEFPILPLSFDGLPSNPDSTSRVRQAQLWLEAGLSVFGIGAKSNSGYGFFDVYNVKLAMQSIAQKAEEAARLEKARNEDAERQARLPPEERFRAIYAILDDEKFAVQAKSYLQMSDLQRTGFVLALKERKDTTKRWLKKKPELIKPWIDFGNALTPSVRFP